MQGYKDQANKDIINNYVAMPDRPQFSAADVAAATGVNIAIVRKVLPEMEQKGYLVRSASKIGRMVYYRCATEQELSSKARYHRNEKEKQKKRRHILKSMMKGVWYSSRSVRISACTRVSFAFLSSMAEEGLLEKEAHTLPNGGYVSYYWRKTDAKQR